jgi:hypothetical protein
MSKAVGATWCETAEELRERYVAERDVSRRKRLQALWLVRRGDAPTEAGRLAGSGRGRSSGGWAGIGGAGSTRCCDGCRGTGRSARPVG